MTKRIRRSATSRRGNLADVPNASPASSIVINRSMSDSSALTRADPEAAPSPIPPRTATRPPPTPPDPTPAMACHTPIPPRPASRHSSHPRPHSSSPLALLSAPCRWYDFATHRQGRDENRERGPYAERRACRPAAVDVVTHRVEVSAPTPEQPHVAPRTVAEWSRLLDDLAHKLDAGRIYDRDLPALNETLTDVIDAFNRRLRA